jgi:hypothetical protein
VADPREDYNFVPMYFITNCAPKINAWFSQATRTVRQVAPEYFDKFENDGNVTHNTDQKAAMIQQLEGRLRRLGEITDDLRSAMRRA